MTKRNLCFFVFLFATSLAQAGLLTVREISVKDEERVEILLDGTVAPQALEPEFVRDIIQFSIPQATIYPAKIIHPENSNFTKIFAYQYSPSLVRIRFNVSGQAADYKNHVKWKQNGRSLMVEIRAPAHLKTDKDSSREASLLAKVLGSEPKVTVEKVVEKTVEAEPSELSSKKSKLNSSSKINSKLTSGREEGPSAAKSFGILFLMLGGLAAILFWVKKKASKAQATKVGENWLSKWIPSSMKKSKQYMEVLAQHALGPKQSIVVMKIKGQQLVLGVTEGNVQLITQLESDENEIGLLDDPNIAASIGKMFAQSPVPQNAQIQATVVNPSKTDNFQDLLRAQGGATQAIAKRAYQSEKPAPVQVASPARPGVRDSIRNRLNEMRQGV